MLEAGDLKKGAKIMVDNDPHIIIDFLFVKPGKGQALYKCKLKNMISGAQFDRTWRSGDKFEKAELEEHQMQFLYADDDAYHFMNTQNYEQIALTPEQVGDARYFLTENLNVDILFFRVKPIGITLPNFVELKITESEPGVKGDTASGSTKPATMETGYTLQVPLFVGEGEVIRIDTRTGDYVERVKR